MLIKLLRYDDAWAGVWYTLSPLARLFLFLLAVVSVYAVIFASVVLVRLRSLRAIQNDNSVKASLALLQHRSANLRQLIGVVFYLSGFTFFFQIQGAYNTPDNNRPVGLMVLENFRAAFRFAAVICLVLLALHSVQWFSSARIRKAALRLDARLSCEL